MSDDFQWPLFEVPALPRLTEGDRVLVRTMWGVEVCVVVATHFDDGYPMVKLTTETGDTISVNVASVRRLDSETDLT